MALFFSKTDYNKISIFSSCFFQKQNFISMSFCEENSLNVDIFSSFAYVCYDGVKPLHRHPLTLTQIQIAWNEMAQKDTNHLFISMVTSVQKSIQLRQTQIKWKCQGFNLKVRILHRLKKKFQKIVTSVYIYEVWSKSIANFVFLQILFIYSSISSLFPSK